MTLSVEISNEAPEHWNDFLMENDTGTIYNSKEYASYAPYEDQNPKFFRIIDATGNIKLQLLLLEITRKGLKFNSIFSKFSRKFSDVIRWNYGPITESEDASKLFFKYLKNSKKRIYGLTHPLSSIRQTEFNTKEWGTFLIDLSNEKMKIFSKIDKHSGRKNIERSIKRKIEIIEMTEKDLPEYVNIINQTRRSYDRAETSNELMNEFWKMLKPAGLSGFVARKDDKMIGALVFSFFNGYINEWGVARASEDYSKRLYSQDLIKWKIIEWGIKNKMRWYDLSGFNPNPKTKKEEGILRYKQKWGGNRHSLCIISN